MAQTGGQLVSGDVKPPAEVSRSSFGSPTANLNCRATVREVVENLILLRDNGSLSQQSLSLLMFSPTLTRSGSDPHPNLMLTFIFLRLGINHSIELEACKEITKKIQNCWKKIRAEEIGSGRVQRPATDLVPPSIRLQGGRPMVFHFRLALDSLPKRGLDIDSGLGSFANRILQELAVENEPKPLDQIDAILQDTPPSAAHLVSTFPPPVSSETVKRPPPDSNALAAAKRNQRQRKE